jgi:membrane fusion protein (multidrug efflux system)/multidrug efflux system membrane fusion protein
MAQATLQAARAEVTRASVELDQARQILERRKQVAWALSEEDLEGLNAREQLASVDLDVARSKAAEQEVHVQKLRDDLGRCKVSAPFPGRIGRIYRTEGSRVAAGEPIARLVADGELWVRFAVPPKYAGWARPGKYAEVMFEENGRKVTARVEYVAPEVDAASGMIFMEARLDRADLDQFDARPGMVARVRPASGG